MKKTVKLLLAVFLAAALFAGCGTKEDTTENKKEEQREPIQDKDTEKEDTEGTKVEITIKDYGTIKISLDADVYKRQVLLSDL